MSMFRGPSTRAFGLSAKDRVLLIIRRKNTLLLLIVKRRTTRVFTLEDNCKDHGRFLHHGLSGPPTAAQVLVPGVTVEAPHLLK